MMREWWAVLQVPRSATLKQAEAAYLQACSGQGGADGLELDTAIEAARRHHGVPEDDSGDSPLDDAYAAAASFLEEKGLLLPRPQMEQLAANLVEVLLERDVGPADRRAFLHRLLSQLMQTLPPR
jgi:hypothetical protein